MKKVKRNQLILKTIFILGTFPTIAFSQGMINNGSHIVISSGSNIVVNTAGTGNYLSQSGGLIHNSSVGGIIKVMGNWTNNAANVAFANDGSTVILSGVNQSIAGSNSTTFYNLTLQGTGTKTLNVNTTVGGIATLTGVLSLTTLPLVLNSNVLTVSNPAAGAITNTTGYIQSETNVALNPSQVKWIVGTTSGSHIIPFGLAAAQIPFTMNITSAMSSVASYVIVSTRPTVATNNTPWSSTVTHMYDPTIGGDGSVQAVIDRWWDLTWSNAATATLTFSYRGAENTLNAPYNSGNLGAQYWAAGWLPDNSNIGSTLAVLAGVGTVTASGVAFVAATYRPMVLTSVNAPLPIELISFAANCNSSSEIISWSTATENNNDFFSIEKSEDGNNFNVIGQVNGSGTSSQVHHYSFADPVPVLSTVYYRLRQTDFNGTSTESTIITGETCNGNINTIDAFASGSEINISLNVIEASEYNIAVFDMQGKKYGEENVSAAQGSNHFLLNGNILAAGIYLVRVTGVDGKCYSKKVMLTQD